MIHIDRIRVTKLLGEAGLDALVVAEPESFRALTSISQGVAGLFRRAGSGFAVVPADPGRPVGVVVGDLALARARTVVADARAHPLWIEQVGPLVPVPGAPLSPQIAASWRAAGRPAGFRRPATFDLGLALAALTAVLADRGLAAGRLGFDLDFIPANDAEAIRAALPGAAVCDGSPVLARLLMVKTAAERERLALALALSEAGLRRLAAGAREGQGVGELEELFREGVAAEAARRNVPVPLSWAYVSVGPQPWGRGGRIAPGSVVKADVGCVVDGYSSDTARNYVWGEASAEIRAFHAVLEEALAAGLAAIRPGVPMHMAHRAATASLHRAGLAGYARGHFGHSLGAGVFSEQWPFIAADAETPFEPGMVMAFEVPIYVEGVGGFNLEDQFAVTETGIAVMTTLPRELLPLGTGDTNPTSAASADEV